MAPEPGVVLQLGLQQSIEDAVAGVIEILPRVAGAVLILLLGWVVGRVASRVIERVADGIQLDSMVVDTPLGRMFGRTEKAVSRAFGRLGAWFIYALAILAAAEVLALAVLSQWLSTLVSYLPAFVAGAAIIIGGFILADFLADAIARTETVTETTYTEWFAEGARAFLYFVVIVMGLDTMGVAVDILFTFATAAAWGLAAGIALAVGIAFGWGGKDYVAENIGSWVGGREPMAMSSAGGSGSDE